MFVASVEGATAADEAKPRCGERIDGRSLAKDSGFALASGGQYDRSEQNGVNGKTGHR